MSKKDSKKNTNLKSATTEIGTPDSTSSTSNENYESELRGLQLELVKLQRHLISAGDKVLVILEGRDAAGKDGCIKRITEHLSPRQTRVVALSKPTDRDRSAWYFQRYVPYLPVAEELVLFNRSWYNRAGVELVLGFCTKAEYVEFMQSVPKFEEMLVHSGIKLFKYYLDISKDEQKRRLADREHDPLKQWKISPLDAVALKNWKAYSDARDAMLLKTHTTTAPWHVVHADNKHLARLNLIRDILFRLHYTGKKNKLVQPNRDIVFEFTPDCIYDKLLAR